MDTKRAVLDSCSVPAFPGGEIKGDQAVELVSQVMERGGALLMSIVNVGEVRYTIARRVSRDAADADVEGLLKLGARFVNADWELTRIAADFKPRHRISYADAFAAALAKKHNDLLVTGDPEFKPLSEEVRILFL